jgi:septal ring factor EnvC (AmiA/AmiB activator)
MPIDNSIHAHETRLTVLEEQTREIRSTLKELATDMRRLAEATIQQAEDRAALKRAFEQIERIDNRITDLQKDIEKAEKERLERSAKIAERDLSQAREDKRKFYWMLVSYGMASIFGAALAHFGITVLK